VPTKPGIPDSGGGHAVRPSHTEFLKRSLIVYHHSVAVDVNMVNTIFFYPSLEQGFGLSVVAYNNNIQRLGCTIRWYSHE
jgi:hypothetical protein